MSISPHLSAVQLQQVLEAAGVGYWEWLPEPDRLWVDERLAGWLGARPASMAAYRALTRDRQHRDGVDCYRAGRFWIEERGVRTEDGRVFGACLDVTDRRRRERALSWEAEHDRLTGLLSRRTFDRLLEQALATATGKDTAVSLLMVDLDRFKAVNDQLGHASGDQVLSTIAQRLRAVVRRTDPVARWGGDEFALVLETDARALRAGGVAQRLLVACRRPVVRDAGAIATHASIGLAVSRVAEDVASLARRADHALYAAKRAGGDRWCLEG
jgi:diguanylate cyclase (GGDEF)-like protein